MDLKSLFTRKKKGQEMQPINPPASPEAKPAETHPAPTPAPASEAKAVVPAPSAVEEPKKTTPEVKTLDLADTADQTTGGVRPEIRPHAFVIMPFDPSMKVVYDEHLVPVANRLGITIKRGDAFLSSQSIIDEVWSAIYHSDICIADCTGRNANVMYELGIAHTLGRPVILISQSVADIPFDISHRRIITYSLDNLDELDKNITSVIKSELGYGE